MPDRRRFVVLAASSLVLPHAAFGQPARVHRLGVLRPTASADATGGDTMTAALPDALRALGYTEGQNLVIETRWADNKIKALPDLARSLVAAKCDLILSVGAAATRAARAASAGAVPVLFFGNFDPVKLGFVTSLASPGGNTTGIVIAPDGTLTGKKVELLAQAVPGTKRMAMLLPSDPFVAPEQLPEARRTAASLGIDVIPVDVKEANYKDAFERIAKFAPQSMFVAASTFFMRDRKQIIELAARNRLPAMYEWPDQVEDGGLMAYGPPSLRSIHARIAAYVDRILKGTNAGTLPVEQPAKLELVINVKTAKALDLAIPQAVLLRADRLIE